MTRLRRIECSHRFFFITSNIAPRASHFSPTERDLILTVLANQRHQGEFFLFGYVVMPTHVHLLLYPHAKEVTQIMRNPKSRTGFEISKHRTIPGQIWQERYFDTIIRQVRNFWKKLEYIHRNPVEASLVEKPEQWLWSSCRHYTDNGEIPIPVDPVGFSSDGSEFLWPAPWR